jgi:ribosomal protein L15
MAGTGKKADQKRPSIWKDTKYFGRHGFASRSKANNKGINIFYIEDHFNTLVQDGKIKKEGDFYVMNLDDMGCGKLLGSGTPSRKYKITADMASESAVAKIQEKQGIVTVKLDSKKE